MSTFGKTAENLPQSENDCCKVCISPESHVRQQASYSLPLHPQLADVYGNVFCIRLGRHKTVFVSGWKMVKEAIVTQADNFVDRPYSPMVTRIYSGNLGESHKPAAHQCWSAPPASWPLPQPDRVVSLPPSRSVLQ